MAHMFRILIAIFLVSNLALAADIPLYQKAIGVEPLPENKLNTVVSKASISSAALFVGVNDFTEDQGLASLDCAVNDAIAQAHVFVRELKLIPAKNCIICLSGKPSNNIISMQLALLKADGAEIKIASKAKILNSLQVITSIPSSQQDMVIVSFSTHGFEDSKGVYLMPSDGIRRYLHEQALYSGTITDSVNKSKARKKLVILDACRERVNKNKSAGLGNAMGENFKQAFASSTGFATLMSCSVGQYSYEDKISGYGVFTRHLLQGLRGHAAADQRGFITVGKINEYVSDGTRNWILRNRPDIKYDKIPAPWLGGSELARSIPLAIRGDIKATDLEKLRQQYQKLEMPIPPSLNTEMSYAQQVFAAINANDINELTRLSKYQTNDLWDMILLSYIKDTYLKPAEIIVNNPVQQSIRPGTIKTNSIGMKLIWISPGSFLMGSDAGKNDQKPAHKVEITKGFWMGQFEVTQDQYQQITGKVPSYFIGINKPVEQVTYQDAVEFCQKLSIKEGLKYQLPTEAQWEYACRAGNEGMYCFGSDSSMLSQYGWYYVNNIRKTQTVGQKKPNSWNLYDMHGNVWEWCSDMYQDYYYQQSPTQDPIGPSNGYSHVLRGGSWRSTAEQCTSSWRNTYNLLDIDSYYGFRVIISE
ncbi:MAG: SUMF1/EgtB/PvdO family nonheme iron enzyme [Phycisphaerae bacterium]|nr:SUMF1/EgtB/PvdO family nonheme iron enzyme [Phycisphaerae bacterium]